MNRIKIAWAAGLFEGEGTVSSSFHNKGTVKRTLARIVLTDEDVLKHFSKVVGFGNFRGPYRQKKRNRKPFWVWQTGKYEYIQTLYRMFLPHLGTRRKQQFEDGLKHKPFTSRKPKRKK